MGSRKVLNCHVRMKQLRCWKGLLAGYFLLVAGTSLSGCSSAQYFATGLQYQNSFNYNDAIASYRRALDLGCTDPVVFANVASCYLKLGKYSQAIPWYERAAEGFRSASAGTTWILAGVSKTKKQMEALYTNDWGVAHKNLNTEQDRLTAIELFRRASRIDPSLQIATDNIRSTVVKPGSSKKVYLDENGQTAWTASWAALGVRMVQSLAKANAGSVLILPVLGDEAIVFADESGFPLTWQAGSQSAQEKYLRSLHQKQDIPVVENFFRKSLSEAKVPVVERDPAILKEVFDEHDFAAVFSSESDLARIGGFVEADAICSIRYDFAFDCIIEYEAGIPTTPLNHYRYRMTTRCVNVRTAESLFSESIDTESIRLAGAHTYGLSDPYYLFALALLAPDLYLSLQQPTINDPRAFYARAMIAAHPMFVEKLHDCARANDYIKRGQAFPALMEPEWVLWATISHAICTGDKTKQVSEYEKLLNLTERWADWYRDSLREMYGQFTR